MLVVWKQRIPLRLGEFGLFAISLPDCLALSVGVQDGLPMMWLEVETEAETKAHQFYLGGTGRPVPDVSRRFVGTYQLEWFVGHLYQLGSEA